MDHVVRYRSERGDDRWEEVAGLDAALKRVEELHQSSSATDVRLYRHVPLEVRTVVQVQVAGEAAATPSTPSGSGPSASGSSSAIEPPSGAMPLTPPPPRGQQPGQEPPEASAASGEQSRKSGLFGR